MKTLLHPSSVLFIASALFCPSGLCAAVKLPAIFADHLVLQREANVPVWGWADAGERITVTVAGQTRTTEAAPDGKWMVTFSNLASSEPTTLSVKGTNTILINDVLVGEVWLGSGQSNMKMAVDLARDFEREQAAAKLPLVRMFRVASASAATPQGEGKGQWVLCSPETVGAFSATLYFFGRELHRELATPVGLINSSVGGTPIESWIVPEAQRTAPELKAFVAAVERDNAALGTDAAMKKYERDIAQWEADAQKARAEKQKARRRPKNPVDVKERTAIGGLFNGMIAPLIPYAIRGALWYQGEANTVPIKAPFYEAQLCLLVNDWRTRWGHEFPMAWAQLPN